MNINELHDFALIAFFKRIPTENLLKYRRVCQRWKHMIENNIFSLKKRLSIIGKSRDYTPQWHSLNDYDRSDIDYIYIDKRVNAFDSRVLKVTLDNCTQLTRFDYIHMPVNCHTMEVIAFSLRNLTVLDLGFCTGINGDALKVLPKMHSLTNLILKGCDVTDDDLMVIEMCPHLEVIDLSNNPRLTGENHYFGSHFKNLNLLECPSLNLNGIGDVKDLLHLSIDMSHVSHFHSSTIMKFLKKLNADLITFNGSFNRNFPELSVDSAIVFEKFQNIETLILNFTGIFPLRDEMILKIMKKCPKVKRFELSAESINNGIYNSMSLLYHHWPMIERLSLKNVFEVTDEILFSISKCPNIWFLSLHANACISDSGIDEVLKCCYRIRHFEIEYRLYENMTGVVSFPNITLHSVILCIETAEKRNGKIFVRFSGFPLELSIIKNLFIPENLTLIVKNRAEIRHNV